MSCPDDHTATDAAVTGDARGWNPFASIAVVLCVPVIFWISALEAVGGLAGFAVEPWMRSAIVTLAVVIIVPIWTGLWVGRAN